MRIQFTYPQGRAKALTFSYDDGVVEDRKLVEIFNTYNVKGTFHINSGLFENENRISASEVAELYRGHEVSCHSVLHPFLESQSRESIIAEIIDDRNALEEIVGYPVVGLSYPMGSYNSRVVEILRALGIVYARTVKATGSFALPDDFLRWHPTCHHEHNIMEVADAFNVSKQPLSLFYVWGHSYEFGRNNNWDLIENFCDKISNRDDIWYATNIEIYEYCSALQQLQFSVSRKLAKNLSSTVLWLTVNDDLMKIEPGQTVNLL